MTAGDEAIEKVASKLDEAVDRTAADGGLKAKLADELADDAAFLRRLKPSLIVARARGRLPKDEEPGSGAPSMPAAPQLDRRPGAKGGPNPFVVVGVMAALGVTVAKLIDWRGHAHPRR
jgi:hypothetical protein